MDKKDSVVVREIGARLLLLFDNQRILCSNALYEDLMAEVNQRTGEFIRYDSLIEDVAGIQSFKTLGCYANEIASFDFKLLQNSGVNRVVVLSKVKDNQVDIPAISQSLSAAGFFRDVRMWERIQADWIVTVYLWDSGDLSKIIRVYEDSIWELQQIADKRRNLLYRDHLEMQRLEIKLESKIKEILQESSEEINFWRSKWDAFWASRTGLALKRFQKIRARVLPRGGILEKNISKLAFVGVVVRREGWLNFLLRIPRRVYKRIRNRFSRIKLRYTEGNKDRIRDIQAIGIREECPPHALAVDIIICVHNALQDVQRCLASILEHTRPPYRLILIDDGSAEETSKFLQEFSLTYGAVLQRSEQATGYTNAANRGIQSSTAPIFVLLNSDTIVTPFWLDRMVCCANSNATIGIVGPLSNTASWQSIPLIEDQGDWAQNKLPENVTPEQMGNWVAERSGRLYPEIPFLNGFCLLVKRELIEKIGPFDSENFGAGYGEEDDFTIRARKAGWKLALADDTYIYHAQSKSYSNEKRRALSERAGRILREKHGEEIIRSGVEICHKGRVMEGIRARAAVMFERDLAVSEGKKYSGKRLLFILPVATPGGGANVIRTEAEAMLKMGVEVEIFNLNENREKFEKAYPHLEIPVVYGDINDIARIALNYDAIVASYNPSVAWMESISQRFGRPVRAYYVQGFEPLMYPEGSPEYKHALASYGLLPDLVRFTKTEWTEQTVYQNTGCHSHLIGVSLDIDLYRPRARYDENGRPQPVRITAMVRPESDYREPVKTMQLLQKAANEFGGEVEIWLFGTEYENPDFLALPHDFQWTLFGILPQEKVASLLSQTDIFIDYSSHQAMGLTALEAMACGNAVIVPEYGGAVSFATHERNSLVVDTANFESVWQELRRLIKDSELRKTIQRNAIYSVCEYFPERAALNILKVVLGDL